MAVKTIVLERALIIREARRKGWMRIWGDHFDSFGKGMERPITVAWHEDGTFRAARYNGTLIGPEEAPVQLREWLDQ